MTANLSRADLSVTPLLFVLLFAFLSLGCERVDGGSAGDGVANRTAGDDAVRGGPGFGSSQERIRAVVLDAREEFGDSTFAALRELGATHLALVSFGFQENASSPEVRFSPDVRWYSESESGARSIAARARAHSLGIILKPQIWLRGGAWTADIGFTREADWITWESSYRDYLMHTARLAEEIDAELLIIGTELSNPVQKRESYWRELITRIRTIYSGPLTYGANWHEDYEDVPFWDALDYVGVQAYFPLTERNSPSISDMRIGWRPHMGAMERISQRENLPILFTEIGYRSIAYAAAEPWRWPTREEATHTDPDYGLQADLFQTFFETVWPQPWFAGAIIWKMYPEGARSDRRALDFTPQGKPAQGLIRRHFNATPDTRRPSDGHGRDPATPGGE
jgi:hypothetical protein